MRKQCDEKFQLIFFGGLIASDEPVKLIDGAKERAKTVSAKHKTFQKNMKAIESYWEGAVIAAHGKDARGGLSPTFATLRHDVVVFDVAAIPQRKRIGIIALRCCNEA